MPIKKPKEPKEPKAPKEKKPKKPKKVKPPKEKKGKKGKDAPVEADVELDEAEQPKKKKFPILLLIPAVVIIAAAVIVFVFVLPKRNADSDEDPEATVSVEPEPPVLPSELPVGDLIVPGMVLEADESEAKAELAKTITYTYTDLVDAGKAAQTYVGQLKTADPKFYLVDEDFVRLSDNPDYTAEEGVALMARNLPKPEPEVEETPSPEPEESGEPEESTQPESSEAPESAPPEEPAEPVDELPDMVLMVRIAWSPGQCVVTADEVEGKVTAPPRNTTTQGGQSISVHGAQDRLESMNPAQLGLEGESMDEYDVFPIDGTEMVNGAACIRMNVYSSNNVEHSNQFMGSYLMSLDGLHLYRLNPVTNEIEELEYQP